MFDGEDFPFLDSLQPPPPFSSFSSFLDHCPFPFFNHSLFIDDRFVRHGNTANFKDQNPDNKIEAACCELYMFLS